MDRARWVLAVLLVGAGAAAAWAVTAPGRRSAEAAMAPARAASGWPGRDAKLAAAPAAFPAGFGLRKVYVDAGHGAPGNTGNLSCLCVDEQDFTLGVAEDLAARLAATGHFEVRTSRQADQRTEYRARVEEAAAWGASAFLSLHSDVRGKADRWSPDSGMDCPISLDAPGFSVLWSDEGEPPLTASRLALARAAARRLEAAGFLAYRGADYETLYLADALQPGVFVDRRSPDQRIFVLRRTVMPSILIETHHALDPREAERWTEERTLEAFAAAVASALVDALPSPPDPAAALPRGGSP